MITFTTFWCYTKLAHRELLVPEALSAMLAFGLIQGPLFELPQNVMFYLRTKVSVRRLDRFFSETELADRSQSTPEVYRDSPTENDGDDQSKTLAFFKSTHIYPQQEVTDDIHEPFKLRCPEVAFPEGKLTVVYGDNASGKSSLLMACLGGRSRFSTIAQNTSLR